MPTLCHCPAGTTAQATIPVWHRLMFHSLRLILQVTFSGCVRTGGKIITTSTRRGWLPWTCDHFRHLSWQLNVCVHRRKPMRNLARKLLRKARQEPSIPVLELQSRFPRNSGLRSLANFVKSMGPRIPRMLPRTVASTRKSEWSKPILCC